MTRQTFWAILVFAVFAFWGLIAAFIVGAWL